jgi:hypothetical protein
MALLGKNLDYSDKDFDSLRARIFNLISGVFPDWTERDVSNFGNILVDLFSFVGDVLLFYQDNQANESRITTAQLRRSLLAMSKLIGFEPQGQTAAQAILQVVLDRVPVSQVNFVAGDLFRTAEITSAVKFQLLQSVSILAGQDPPVASLFVENSSSTNDLFPSTGKPNQEFILRKSPYLEGSLYISAGDGAYTEQESLLDSGAADRHCTVSVDENDRAKIIFGNGVNGKIPSGNITFYYKTGGGTRGNVLANTIVIAEKSYGVSLLVTNTNPASGGAARQSTESIREEAPRSLRALTRTVTREDYEIHAAEVLGVARTLMLTSNERDAIQENRGQLIIVPEGGGLITTVMRDQVLNKVTVEYPNTLTFIVDVFSAVYLQVNIKATVHLTASAVPATVDADIRIALSNFFAIRQADGSLNPQIDFGFNLGGSLAYSDIYNLIRDISGVRKIDDRPAALQLNESSRDVRLETYQFPTLGSITLLNGVTDALLV